ncbi:flagellar basal body-associated FliL family protein [Sphingomonas sp. S1-29]|uniref:flagellar basal body-associated FliL family protein n=1 Tax=Sphingomonas sp. S1-29 TaxID=2991074 RepID=UPI0022401A63|nr:flagellar basal body-associated FliL family protein [Sphingomonas sp. S1-29]UZK68880.1 flagellar basal body-associated FliL family protein [Sphingomonas sp. S1-29]
MSDKKDDAPKKKGGIGKWIGIGVALVALVGGGVGAGLYASSSGMLRGGEAKAEGPRLVPKEEEKRAAKKEGEEGEAEASGDAPTKGEGGDSYASNYYALEKEFTSNLLGSVHFVQIGVAVSTPYDDSVIEGLKTHEIAVRSAILMALGETDEEQVFSTEGKRQLQKRLVKAINDTLKEKEGFGGIGNVYFTNFVVQ